MKRFRLSPNARNDLDEIWVYVARERTTEAADRLVDSLTQRFSLLADMPNIGRKRDDLEPGARSLPVGSYVIYYRRSGRAIEISRVVHGARDVKKLFGAN